ncbi:MAG: phosphatidylglycerophosphatase A [Pseudobdellovibrionaceae bacterium]
MQKRWEEHRITLGLVSLKDPQILLATWFGCGCLFPGPGAWGTLGALPLGVALMLFGGPWALVLASLILFVIGVKVSRHFEHVSNRHDSSIIVIDEAAAVILALSVAPPTPFGVVTTFFLFRLFDVAKPFPIGWVDKRVPGEWGVMLDDTIAAIYTMIVIGVWHYAKASL